MDWREIYKDKLVTMEKAAKTVKSGDCLFVGETCAMPYSFLNALNDRRNELENVTLLYNFTVNMHDMLFDEETKKHFRLISWFTGPLDRMSAQMDIAEFHSAPYEYFIEETMNVYKADTMVIEVCEPDEDGYCNVGILSAAYFKAFYECPIQFKKKIAVVNKFQSPAQGSDDNVKVKVDWFDYLTEDDHELPYIPVSPPTDVDKSIANYIMPYVNDGDTVQIGMGGLGEEITKELYSKKNITIYTEIAVDSMVDIANAGAVTKLITCGAFGSPKIYEFLGTSPIVEFRGVADMLDPAVIGQQDNLVAINSTLMVDLTGQACSEAQGINQYSSVGGSFGYLYGATRSKGGRSFLCLRSTYKDKQGVRKSSIVPWLPEKSVVTTPRYMQMYIVSEYGVADVYLKTNKDRIRAILKIAHPDYRNKLKADVISVGQIYEQDFE